MNRDELKKHYFEKGARALRSAFSIDQDCYCCPICKRFYLIKAIEVGLLTLEHAPPKKVGGKPLALTCKECNSFTGYSIDSEVVRKKKFFDAIEAIMGQKRNYRGRATLSMGGEEINIQLEVDENSISIKPPKNINDPKKLTAYKNYMTYLHEAGKWDGEEFSLTPLNKYHIKHSKIGDLKTAFIICFAFFGYTYILDSRLSPVRDQIINFKSDLIERYWLESDPNINQQHFICLVEKPVPAVAVRIDKSTVILPWLEGPNDLYKHLNEKYDYKEPFTFHGRFFNWPKTLDMNLDFFKVS